MSYFVDVPKKNYKKKFAEFFVVGGHDFSKTYALI